MRRIEEKSVASLHRKLVLAMQEKEKEIRKNKKKKPGKTNKSKGSASGRIYRTYSK